MLILLSNSLQKIPAIFVKLLNFTLPISTNFLKFFLPSGGSAPEPPLQHVHIRLFIFSIIKNLWPARKVKKFSEKFAFFLEFSQYFSIFY